MSKDTFERKRSGDGNANAIAKRTSPTCCYTCGIWCCHMLQQPKDHSDAPWLSDKIAIN